MIRPLVASTSAPERTEVHSWDGTLVGVMEYAPGTWKPAPPLTTRLAWLIAVTRHLAGAHQ